MHTGDQRRACLHALSARARQLAVGRAPCVGLRDANLEAWERLLRRDMLEEIGRRAR